MTDDTYDFVDPDLPEKREVERMLEEKADDGALFGEQDREEAIEERFESPEASDGGRLSDEDRERLQESGHLPLAEMPEVRNRRFTVEPDDEDIGTVCADPEQMESFNMEERYPDQTEGYSDKPTGSYQQRGFLSRCFNKLRGLL